MQIIDAKLHHLTAPAQRPIKTSFGTMQNRHAIFLELTAETGNGTFTGWGESWINFPSWAPEERKAAFQHAYIPYLLANSVSPDISRFMSTMAGKFAGPAIQSETIGALISSLCAIETALLDIEARSNNIPLAWHWFDKPASEVEIYASGINAPLPFDDIDAMLALGVKLFKLKLGFGDREDIENLKMLRKHLKGRAQIAVDVNRKWSTDKTLKWLPRLKEFNIRWLEEPLNPWSDSKYPEVREAAARVTIPIAAGENHWSFPGLLTELQDPLSVDIFQPDITKNLSPSQTVREVITDRARKDRFTIPHYLGSAIGQAASLHLSAGCPLALCEWDINPNPLRTNIFTEPFVIKDGKIKLPAAPGLGWTPNPDAFRAYH